MADRPNRSTQRAGEGAQQLQIDGDVYLGVTPAEAIEIARLVAQDVVASFTAGALAEATKRIDAFDRKLVEVLDQEHSLAAFSEPAFQILIKKAQRSAAASGRDSDYDRLAELLSRRAHEDDRKKRAAVDRAVEVVDLVDDAALAGLTAVRYFLLESPTGGAIGAGLDQFEKFATAIVDLPLPEDEDWIEHLDSLGLVRIARLETFHPAKQVLANLFKGYVCPGVENTSENVIAYYAQANQQGVKARMEEHELRDGFLRIPVSNDSSVRALAESHPHVVSSFDAFLEAAKPTGYGTTDPAAMSALLAEIDSRPTTRALIEWWDQPRVGFRHTPAGAVLAAANSRRLMRAVGLST
ncbi:hypothetical protein GCM10023350_53060 [Nocardioides endophyticus]|uniref:DUF222 domain-containing protein n=1 Tax=Nocardioides endophyticus TaxID=1353775 RepID=A0ABP8ZNA3_9ACTN